VKLIAIMSTYNGEKFIAEQLDSLLSQSHPLDWIIVRDDGSTDRTPDILEQYSQKYPAIIEKVIDNLGNLGLKSSYFKLLTHALEKNPDYLLYTDQDDVWLPDKIERLLGKIQVLDSSRPALVFSDARVVDQHLQETSSSVARFQKFHPVPCPPSLKSLLLHCPILACTMMLNAKLHALMVREHNALLNPDKWALIVATIAGNVSYLDEPTLLYRQHSANALGMRGGIRRKWFDPENRRFLRQRYQEAVDEARYLLTLSLPFSHDEQKQINDFIHLFTTNIFARIANYFKFCLTPPHWKRKMGLLLSLFFRYQ